MIVHGWSTDWGTDTWGRYGSVRVTLDDGTDVAVGVYVGVPERDRVQVTASRSRRPFVCAEYVDASDWDAVEPSRAQEVLEAIREARWRLDRDAMAAHDEAAS